MPAVGVVNHVPYVEKDGQVFMQADETRALTSTEVRGSTAPGALIARTSSPRSTSAMRTSMDAGSRVNASLPIAPSLIASTAPPPARTTIATTEEMIHFHTIETPFRD